MNPVIDVNRWNALQWEAYAIKHCGNEEPTGALHNYYSAGHACGIFGSDGRASLIIDNVKRIVILTFRGSANDVNRFNDIRIDGVSLQGIAAGSLQEPLRSSQVHAGFAYEYGALQTVFNTDHMYTELQRVSADNGWHILLTGHSLGGALATLCAADLLLRGAFNANSIALITFGSPRTGDCAFAGWIDRVGLYKNIRVEIDYDPAVSVPAQNGGAYWHRGCLSRIQLDNGTYRRMHHDENSGEINGLMKGMGNVLSAPLRILPFELSNYATSIAGILIDLVGSVGEIVRTGGAHVPYLCHMGYWNCQEYLEH